LRLEKNWVVGKGIFDIDIFKLTNGKHTFEFDFDSSFFSLFEDSVVEKGEGTVLVELDRTPNLMTFVFHLKGEIELVCDRSLDRYMFPLDQMNEIRVKYGDHWEELSEELILIPAKAQKIDVGQLVYEFITLATPMKKLHPRYQNEADDNFIFSSSAQEDDPSDNQTDPRWNVLKKLKKK
jgi:DUF177 domain-containing protein